MAGDAKRSRSWVGRSIRRLEDPTLVVGHGRFTGDLPAARWIRFVRSSVASGRIMRIAAPEGAMVLTTADMMAVKPIRPMMHKFNYVPISQPVLARDVVRFVGEPIAAVVSPTQEEAEDIVSRSTSKRCRRWSARLPRSRTAHRSSTPKPPETSSSKGG